MVHGLVSFHAAFKIDVLDFLRLDGFSLDKTSARGATCLGHRCVDADGAGRQLPMLERLIPSFSRGPSLLRRPLCRESASRCPQTKREI